MGFDNIDHDGVVEQLLEADEAALLLALVEATGRTDLLERFGAYISDPFDVAARFPEEVRAELVELAAASYLEGTFNAAPRTDDVALFERLSDAAAQRAATPIDRDLFRKEMGLLEEAFVDWTSEAPERAADYRVVIVGAGLSGIAAAIHLKRMGIDFTIYDRFDDVGGTWLVNVYPGCAVDILSHYFSYSFDLNPNWTSYYSPQREVLDYLRSVVDEYGLREHMRFGVNVTAADFDDSTHTWSISLEDADGARTERANILVAGIGALSDPLIPDLPGMDRFSGEITHSATWDPAIDVDGKRVALVGNGASANQIGPNIADRVDHLVVMTRSPQWVSSAPKYGDRVKPGEQWALRNIDAYARWFRVRSMLAMNEALRPNATVDPEYAKRGMVSAANEQLKDRLTEYMRSELGHRQDLLDKLVPDFPPGMKRMLRDNGWCRMFTRDNVELVSSRAAAMDETGIIDAEGDHHDVDVVIFATGFKVARMVGSFEIHGTEGSLRETWGEDDPRAFLGMSVPTFPNLFILYGPNTNVGVGGSIFFQAEAQSQHIARMIRDVIERGATRVEVQHDAFETYNERMDEALETMIWSLPLGSTWYRNSKGRVVANMPWTSADYWQMTRTAGPANYAFKTLRPQLASASSRSTRVT